MSKLLNKPTPTVEQLAKKYSVSVVEVKKQLMKGIKVEKEHTNDPRIAREIALDHLNEKLDYYTKLSKIEEESTVGGVRGLGYVSGDPSGTDYIQQYIGTNMSAYSDDGAKRMKYVNNSHNKLHTKTPFKTFDPSNIKGNKNFMNEGISAGPVREIGYVGDPTGGRTLGRNLDMKEGAKLDKAKKALAVGATIANMATLSHVAGNATEGHGSPKHDIVRAAATLPGPTGIAAKGINYAKMAYDKYKQLKETGQVMTRYTERPMYEGWASIGHPNDWAGDRNPKAKIYGDKPKTTTKNDEKDDTYNNSNKGKEVKFVKPVKEDWQKVNRKDKTDGLSQKAVDAYKRENPGSKLQTAVTEKNPSGKRAARRKSFCSRMSGMKKRLTSAKTARDPDSRINKALRRWNCEEEVQINELEASTLGSYIKKASASRKKSLEGPKPDVKTWGKRQKGITTAIKKLTTEETMDTKQHIQEGIESVLENNLVAMKENFTAALQEKVEQKLEERKKEIAANYFAQD